MFIWNGVFEATYDSSWCYVEKVSWLNACKSRTVLQYVSNCNFNPSLSSWGAPYSYVDTAWLYVGKPRAPTLPARTTFCDDLARGIDERSGASALRGLPSLLFNTRLRVCHACLSEGYHSVVHQIEGLRICPIHELPLSTECPNCCRGLGDFSARRSGDPFQCSGCRVSFLKGGLLKPPSDLIRQGEQERMGPFVDWLKQVSLVSVHWLRCSPDWRFRLADERFLRTTTFQASVLPCLAAIHPCPLADHFLERPAAGLELIPVEDMSSLYAWEVGVQGVMEHREAARRMQVFVTQVADEVTLGIEQLIKGHQGCLNDVVTMVASISTCNEFELSANPDICGAAQAFLIWNSRVRQFSNSLGLWAGQGWSPDLDAPFAALLKTEMECMFYYSAYQIAFLQSMSTLNMMQRYAAICTAHYPCFVQPRDRYSTERSNRGAGYVFRLRDEGVLPFLHCDQGRYVRHRMDTLRNTINAMVEQVHPTRST